MVIFSGCRRSSSSTLDTTGLRKIRESFLYLHPGPAPQRPYIDPMGAKILIYQRFQPFRLRCLPGQPARTLAEPPDLSGFRSWLRLCAGPAHRIQCNATAQTPTQTTQPQRVTIALARQPARQLLRSRWFRIIRRNTNVIFHCRRGSAPARPRISEHYQDRYHWCSGSDGSLYIVRIMAAGNLHQLNLVLFPPYHCFFNCACPGGIKTRYSHMDKRQ